MHNHTTKLLTHFIKAMYSQEARKKENMPKGANPNSHGNNRTVGIQKQIRLPSLDWEVAFSIGSENYAQGVRGMMKLAQSIASRNIYEASILFRCESAIEALSGAILAKYSGIESGRKNHLDLAAEIALGECAINSDFKREVTIVQLIVQCPMGSGRAVVEDKQVWSNGRAVERRKNGKRRFPAEKVYKSESILDAGYRACQEELGITPICVMDAENFRVVENDQSAYQGVESVAKIHQLIVDIGKEDYKDEYIEAGASKSTYFIWE